MNSLCEQAFLLSFSSSSLPDKHAAAETQLLCLNSGASVLTGLRFCDPLRHVRRNKAAPVQRVR